MAVMIVRYLEANRARWGRLRGDAPTHAKDLVALEPIVTDQVSTGGLIAQLDSSATLATTAAVNISASQLLSPITTDASLLCQGLNYGAHAAEAQQHVRKSNLIFSKASSSLTGPFSGIIRPADVELLDYEVEIGVVLRTDLREPTEVSDANVGDFVAGVVLCDDVSARDTMFGATFLQWFQGKSYRTFCPAGPVLYLLDRTEVADTLANLEIKLSLNGELRQSASSAQLIFEPAETLAYISQSLDMKRGDVLLTGTPGGVTAPATPELVEILKTHLMADTQRRDELRAEMVKARPFMQPGDILTTTLFDRLHNKSLGGHENTIEAARSGRARTTVAGSARRAAP
jgi:2-keto-4-pentenoate hydratase/2-oxohepta-3-ene-1,7-dioic acid hydratase in catechol pathway